MFLISLSVPLFFVYRMATDFLELILYPATVLKVLISCRSSLVEFLGLLVYTTISSANSESLTSSFPIRIPLIHLCCLIAVAGNSSTMLKRYGESGQPCIVPDFSGMALIFSLFNLI